MNNFYFWLNTMANLLQIENYNLNLKDATNTQLNNHLQQQDQILSEQIGKKLDIIIQQNEEIIKLLKKEWVNTCSFVFYLL